MSLQNREGRCLATSSDFLDVAGPYVNPPERAAVLRAGGVRPSQGAPLTGQVPRPACVMLGLTGRRGTPERRERSLRAGRRFVE